MASNFGFERLVTALLAACAVLVTGMVAYRTFAPTSARQGSNLLEFGPPQQLDSTSWRRVAAAGERMGSARAPMQIVEFSDFECPACRYFTLTVLDSLRRMYPGGVAVTFRHWPLQQHKFARMAARASRCAARQGAFEAFHNVLYENQDSIGLLPFREFARRSSVPDLAAFDACSTEATNDSGIDEDVALVVALGGKGTPTVVVDGLLFSRTPSVNTLDSLMRTKAAR